MQAISRLVTMPEDPAHTKNEDVNVNTLDLRCTGIPLWSEASLELGVYALVNETKRRNR